MNKFTCKVYNFLKHEQFLFLLRNPVRPHWLCIIPTTIVLTDAWCILIASHNRGATFCSHTIHTRTKPQIVCLVCKLLPATKNCNWQRQLVHFAISNDDDQLLLEDLKWISCATCTVLFFSYCFVPHATCHFFVKRIFGRYHCRHTKENERKMRDQTYSIYSVKPKNCNTKNKIKRKREIYSYLCI